MKNSIYMVQISSHHNSEMITFFRHCNDEPKEYYLSDRTMGRINDLIQAGKLKMNLDYLGKTARGGMWIDLEVL